jgi:hypothetical protein
MDWWVHQPITAAPSTHHRCATPPQVELPSDSLRGEAFVEYYNGLIRKYLGEEKMFF